MYIHTYIHCVGHVGDVFIANYLTAHLIAPNASPEIRYAVYFRLKGEHFQAGCAADGSNVRC